MKIKSISPEVFPSGRGRRIRKEADYQEIRDAMRNLKHTDNPLEISGLVSANSYREVLKKDLRRAGKDRMYDITTEVRNSERMLFIKRRDV